MRTAITVVSLLLAGLASARLVSVIVPPPPVLVAPHPVQAAQPKAPAPRVVVIRVVERKTAVPMPVYQYLDGHTSVSPQWKEVYPGMFIRER